MKALPIVLTTALLSIGSVTGLAQARAITGNGFDSGGINIVPKTDPANKVAKTVRTIEFVAVSPVRVWKSSDSKQKPITGSLLAFEREAKTGKVSIVRDEKVRLLVGKKDFTLPLTKLSPDDQAFIGNLVDSARIAGKLLDAEAEEKTEPAGAKAKAEPANTTSDKPAK